MKKHIAFLSIALLLAMSFGTIASANDSGSAAAMAQVVVTPPPSGAPNMPITTSFCAIFNNSIQQGSTGTFVHDIQVFLNKDTDTKVAVTGAGSPGNETSYFGPATRAAVIKFQNKYAADILTPIGLTSGTGVVGSRTVAKINALSGCGTTGAVSVTGVSPQSANVGDTVIVTGSGFTPTGNTVLIGTAAIGNTTFVSSTSLQFTLPNGGGPYCPPINGQATACPMYYMLFRSGSYQLSVANSNGKSNSVDFIIATTTSLSIDSPAAGDELRTGKNQDIVIHYDLRDPMASLPATLTVDLSLAPIPASCQSGMPCPALSAIKPYVIATSTIANGSSSGFAYSWRIGDTVEKDRTISLGTYHINACISGSDTCGTSGNFTIK